MFLNRANLPDEQIERQLLVFAEKLLTYPSLRLEPWWVPPQCKVGFGHSVFIQNVPSTNMHSWS